MRYASSECREIDLHSLVKDLPHGLRQALGEIFEFDRIDSTNDEALRRLRDGKLGHCLIVAREQSAGRGRRGHQWQSPGGAGLYFSLVRELPLPLDRILALGPVAALALRAGLSDLEVFGLSVKWPNDLLSGNRKLGGILVETHGADEQRHVVVGVGLNLRFPPEVMKQIDKPAVDLATICEDDPDWTHLMPAILNRLLEYIGIFRDEGFAFFQDEWNKFDRYFQQDVVVQVGDEKTIGRVSGVDETGALLVRNATGVQRMVSGTIFPSRHGAGPKP